LFKRASFIRLLLSEDLVTSLVAAEIGPFFLTWNKPTQVYVKVGYKNSTSALHGRGRRDARRASQVRLNGLCGVEAVEPNP